MGRRSRNTYYLTDFVNDALRAETTEEIMVLLRGVAKAFGLEHFAISGLPLPGEPIDPFILLDAWPGDWAERYQAKDYVHHDPVIQITRRSNDPFIWSEKVVEFPLNKLARQVMDEASEFGMKDGFAVPLHGINGLQAIVTFSAAKVEMTREMRATLQLIATFAHSRLRAMMRLEREYATPIHVTPREQEVLRWLSDGKTVWETGEILGANQSTITSHVRALKMKFNVTNTAQLVAEGFRSGLLR